MKNEVEPAQTQKRKKKNRRLPFFQPYTLNMASAATVHMLYTSVVAIGYIIGGFIA
jgi:hypothetical protein